MNNQSLKRKHPFDQNRIANKSIAIQKDSYKNQIQPLGFLQINRDDLILTIFKLLLPFLFLVLTYLANQ